MLQIDETQCSNDQNLNNDFPIMAVVKIVISIAAFFLTASLFVFHTRKFAVHPNTRLIMKSHYTLALFNGVAQAVVPIYEIYNYTFFGSKCYLTTHAHCVLLTIWPYFAICAVGYSLTWISLERLHAFVLYRYFNTSPKRWMGYVFVFGQWMTPIVEIASMLRPCDFKRPISRCSFIIQENVHVFFTFIIIFLCFELFAAIVFVTINILAKKERMTHFNGSDIAFTRRYELQQMLRTLSLLIPTVTLHSTVFLLPYTIVDILIGRLEVMEQDRFLFFIDLLDWSSLYGVALPIIIYTRKAIAQRLFKRNIQINVSETQDKHFLSLKNNWDCALSSTINLRAKSARKSVIIPTTNGQQHCRELVARGSIE
ncbi:hypothetical protein QR680_000128 [Steinernema hermaphroditum]|uniref:G-protein coupled receptors family 1 profile domain-containing protein n=1 Tax=Steinernema hermaphroditum TaxID=289476 RepID=A0AA39GTI5_9BILA|nr:hypothetical protein QR680_000128 [Steinernema hermaphroditum]